MVTIIIYICEALIVLSLLMMLGFGLRGLATFGRLSLLRHDHPTFTGEG